jgi:hypothetical protein
MGVGNPDIVDIWQFDFPDSLPTAWQRLGCGKRRSPGIGIFILIYPLRSKGMSGTHQDRSAYNRCFRSIEIHCSK